MEVSLDRSTGSVTAVKCFCHASYSSYCNHIMALLLELADYTLNQLDCVPEQIASTSKNRQWGIPSEAKIFRDPIIKSPIRSDSEKKVQLGSTLYERRQCETNIQKFSDFQTKLIKKDERIGFALAIFCYMLLYVIFICNIFAHVIDLNLVTKSKTQ